jgi:hypothetical protein
MGNISFAGAGNLLRIHGYFALTYSGSALQVAFDAQVQVFSSQLRVSGSAGIYGGANPGISINILLSATVGGGTTVTAGTSFFSFSGNFRLQINTRNVSSEGVAANTYRVSVTNFHMTLAGFTLSGSVTIGVSNGIFSVNIPATDPIRASIWNFASVSFSGYFRSNGQLSLTASLSVVIGSSRLNLTGTVSFSFTRIAGGSVSFAASISGRIVNPIKDFSIGSLSVDSNGRVKVDIPFTWSSVVIDLKNRSLSIDGPVAGAIVVLDVNRNGVVDPGEPVTFTNTFGEFVFEQDLTAFDLDLADIIILSGTDITTGIALRGTLRGPASGLLDLFEFTVSPLTTLAVTLRDIGMTLDEAEQLIFERYLPASLEYAGLSFQYINPFDSLLGARQAEEAAIFAYTALISNTVAPIAAMLDAASTSLDRDEATLIAYRALALSLVDGPMLDLTDADNLLAILATAASEAGVVLDAAETAVSASALANANASLLAIVWDDNSPVFLDRVIRHQMVTQGVLAEAIASGDAATIAELATAAGLNLALDAQAIPAFDYPNPTVSRLISAISPANAEGRFRFLLSADGVPLETDGAFKADLQPFFLELGPGLQPAMDRITVTLAANGLTSAHAEIRTSADNFSRVLAVLEFTPDENGDLVAMIDLRSAIGIAPAGLEVRVQLTEGAGVAEVRVVTVEGFIVQGFSGLAAEYLASGSTSFADFLNQRQHSTQSTMLTGAGQTSGRSAIADETGSAAELSEAAALLNDTSTVDDRLRAAYNALYAGL